MMFEGNPLSIYNLYSPPPKMLNLRAIQPEGERMIIVGDFNSHSPSWGYPDLDPKGDKVENWIMTIATDDGAKITERYVEQQLGGSDHKPVRFVIKQDLLKAGRKLCPS